MIKGRRMSPLIEAVEIEEKNVSVGEDALTEEEEDVEHELTRASRLISHLV